MKELIRDAAATAAQGIVVTRRPSDFYGAAPSLHIQNRYGADFSAQLLHSRKHDTEDMWVLWDMIAAEDKAFRELIVRNHELNLSHIVIADSVAPWLLPHMDCAFVLPGAVAPALGVSEAVPAGHYASVDLTDLRHPTIKILPLDQEDATV